ncbi:hypothetical protein J4450_02305 [Candidatus Micrarchaeota archaeon]|nr:hypothetical protein [Candidatus Micrarchaeota archaeon]
MKLPKQVSYLPTRARGVLVATNAIFLSLGLLSIAAMRKPAPDRIAAPQAVVVTEDNGQQARETAKDHVEKLESEGKLYEAAIVYIEANDISNAKRLADKLAENGDKRANEIYEKFRRLGIPTIPIQPATIEDMGGPTARQAAEFRLQASNAEKNGDLATAATRWYAAGTLVDKANAKICADKYADEAQAEANLTVKASMLEKAVSTYRAIGDEGKAAGLEIILETLKKSPEYLENMGKKLEAAHAYLDKKDAANANRLRNELAGKAKTRKDREDVAGLDRRLSELGVLIPLQPWNIEPDKKPKATQPRAKPDRVERPKPPEEVAPPAPFNANDYRTNQAKPVYERPLALLLTRYRNDGKFGDATSITIRFTIGTNGKAKNATAELNGAELPDRFQAEFERALAPLRFPKPAEEVGVTLQPKLK